MLEKGDHTTKGQTLTPANAASIFSNTLGFIVGDKDSPFNRSPVPGVCNKNGDINNDHMVNIVDFSILMYFWNQKNSKNKCSDVNADGTVNVFDFSIMLYWWTG